jgi:hypothetical protein
LFLAVAPTLLVKGKMPSPMPKAAALSFPTSTESKLVSAEAGNLKALSPDSNIPFPRISTPLVPAAALCAIADAEAAIAIASTKNTAIFLIVSPRTSFGLNLTTLHLYLYVLVFFLQ